MSEVWLAARHMASTEAMQVLSHPDALEWTSDERRRLEALTAPRRRAQFMVGHALLRELLSADPVAAHLAQPQDLVFPVDRAPAFAGAKPALSLGLAHSGEWIIAAASTGLVGVDLECFKPRPQWRDLASTVCPEIFEFTDASLEDFYGVWTVKEAWLKSRERPATLENMQSLRVRAPMDTDANTAHAWRFDLGVMSCLAPRGASFLWPLGCPQGLNLHTATEWALDDHRR